MTSPADQVTQRYLQQCLGDPDLREVTRELALPSALAEPVLRAHRAGTASR
jgi:hypothetical protein